MGKKILIGSIIAVIILIFVSITPVVGFQLTKSTSVKESPLFLLRIRRAIGKGSNNNLESHNIGKEKTYSLLLPKRNERTFLLMNFIDRISLMSSSAFNRFVYYMTEYFQTIDQLSNIDSVTLKTEFQKVRDNPEGAKQYALLELDDKTLTVSVPCTSGSGIWYQICYVIFIIVAIFYYTFIAIYELFFGEFPTYDCTSIITCP